MQPMNLVRFFYFMENTYSEKLKDPRWQKKRLEVLKRDNFSCVYCGDNKSTLQIHHIRYNGEPWEQDNKFLITLCRNCHIDITEKQKDMKLLIDEIPIKLSYDHYSEVKCIIESIIKNKYNPYTLLQLHRFLENPNKESILNLINNI